MVDMDFQMGLSCWEFEAILPSPGSWECTFRRTTRGESGCTDESSTPRACDLVEVEPSGS
jgi:hypothetical protein